jgi:hypothetical protein
MDWLKPLPLAHDPNTWAYTRTDTGHLFPISITGIIGAVTLSDADRENIERYRPIWEPRGNTVHACLEAWLKTQVRPSADEVGAYGDWVYPLIDHEIWQHCDVIGSEHRVYDMRQNWAGTLDVVVRWHKGGHGVIDLKTKSSTSSSKQDVRPQLGAGTRALIDRYILTMTRNLVLWSYPGEMRPEGFEAQDCLDAWADTFDLYKLLHRPF